MMGWSKIYKYLFITITILTAISIGYYFYNAVYKKRPSINKIYQTDSKIYFEFSEDGECKIDGNYIKSSNKICEFEYENKIDKLMFRNKYNVEFEYDIYNDFSQVNDIYLNVDKMYLPINGREKIEYTLDSLGKIEDNVEFKSENSDVASVSEDGEVTGLSDGTTKIHISIRNIKKEIDVTVTHLIVERPDEYNYSREYLKCNQYTKEENDLLDEILKYRVGKVGYNTRAGVVEAARFIALEFPYRITYFSENGRLHTYGAASKVDGEGRYYHEGLYLDESRYELVYPRMHGPGTWGCQIFSNPSNGYRANGFDCSGFISWILLNGGFDSEDVGAGVSTYKDLTDLGEKKYLTTSTANDEIKAGDLLSGDGPSGGHIALVAGKNNGYYYVAESLWYGTGYLGSLIRKYDANELNRNFYWHVDLDEYYQKDGNYTDYWK